MELLNFRGDSAPTVCSTWSMMGSAREARAPECGVGARLLRRLAVPDLLAIEAAGRQTAVVGALCRIVATF